MDKTQIADIAVKARNSKGYTKYKVSKLSGLAIGQIERIESGKDNYTIDLLNKYVGALNLKISIK